jgi:hypothetical protein
MMRPPAVLVSSSILSTMMRSCNGLIFMRDSFRALKG